MRLPDDSQSCIRSALRRRRRALGLTQNDAANLLGMSRVSYHRIETGVRRIRFVEIAAICEAFNCHVGELVQDGQLASAYVHAAKAILGEAAIRPVHGPQPRLRIATDPVVISAQSRSAQSRFRGTSGIGSGIHRFADRPGPLLLSGIEFDCDESRRIDPETPGNFVAAGG
jgi:transcriptional regulator with XRE-family HTH domain